MVGVRLIYIALDPSVAMDLHTYWITAFDYIFSSRNLSSVGLSGR